LTHAARWDEFNGCLHTIVSMAADEEPDTYMYVADVVPADGPETKAAVNVTYVKARDLDESHAGKWIGGHERGYNYGMKILKVKHINEGKAPGVTVWYRKSQLPDGTPAADSSMHIPFDTDIEIVDMMAW
jgi:hypothetical protein